MPLNKVLLLTILLLTSFLSGCQLLRQTNFTLLSYDVDDDAGFPRMILTFNTSDTTILTLTTPYQTTLFSDTYYTGIHNESIYLSDYRTTVSSGVYRLQATDASKHTIFENEFSYNGANLSLLALSADVWTTQAGSFVVTIYLTVQNTGDLPAYPYRMALLQGTTKADAILLPSVVLPTQTTQLTCFLPLTASPDEDTPLTITMFDNNDRVLLQSQSLVMTYNQVGSWDYRWSFLGQYTLKVPNVDWFFDYYRNIERFNVVDYAAYVFDPYDDQFIQFLIDQILSLKDLRTNVETINFVASFVQSIEYKNDDPANTSYEYPRYPIETLKEKRGDCEDKAILTAALLDALGFNVTLLRLPQHMAVGVHLNETIAEYTYYVDQYYFLETTTMHMMLGRVPPEYEGITNVTIYPITERFLLIHHWKSATRFQVSTGEDYVRVQMILENLGASETSSIEVRGAFYDNASQMYNLKTISVPSISSGGKRLVELSVDVPVSLMAKATTLKTQLFMNDILVNERVSTSRFP